MGGRLDDGGSGERLKHRPRVAGRHCGSAGVTVGRPGTSLQSSSGMSPAAQNPAGRARSHAGSPTPRSSTSMSSHGSEADGRPSWPRCQSPCTSVVGRSGDPARHTSGGQLRRPRGGRWRASRVHRRRAAAAAANRGRHARGYGFAVQPGQQSARLGPRHAFGLRHNGFHSRPAACAIAIPTRSGRRRAASAENPTPPRCGAGSPVHAGRCPAGAACRPRRRRRRSLHRTGSAPLDRISAWAAAGALSRRCGSRR